MGMKSRALAAFGSAAFTVLTAATLSAQQPGAKPDPAPPQASPPVVVPMYPPLADASAVRDQLQELLRQYPPSVGEVLRRDPSLLSRPDYIAPYPQLVLYLQQHPEIVRNPQFYFGGYDYFTQRREPLSPSIEALGVLLGGMAGLLFGAAFLGVLAWLVRAVIQHRRWIKTSSIQAEVHTKLMDRLTNNEELLAYIQSPAGRKFLESAPIQPEADAPRHSAPVGPIIWSMMAGIVLATVGVGFRVAASTITDEAQQAFSVVGVIILALGGGFILAAIMAYLVSLRMGLFPPRISPDASSGNA